MQNEGEVLERRYRRRKLMLLGLSAVASALGILVVKTAGDENVVFPGALGSEEWHLPLAARIVIAAIFFAALAFMARLNWQASDEVRRSHMISFWAAIGMSVSLTFFVFILFGAEIPRAARLPLAFMLPIAMGSLFSIARWLRDGYVW